MGNSRSQSFNNRTLSKARFSAKMKELRAYRHFTQNYLADRAGIDEAAIRCYETQGALPRQEHLEALANTFNIRPEALRLYDFSSSDSVTINALFQLADGYGLMPLAVDDQIGLAARNDFMSSFLHEWTEHYTELSEGRMALEDYKKWQDCFVKAFSPSDFPKRYELVDGDYRAIEPYQRLRFSQKLKGLRMECHLTQDKLATITETGVGAIRTYEQALRLPRVSQIEALAKVFGVTVGSLLFYDFGSPIQAAHALFQLADEYGLYPCYREQNFHLVAGMETPSFFIVFINHWYAAYKKWAQDDDRAYELWKQHYELTDAYETVNRKPLHIQHSYLAEDSKALLIENRTLKQTVRELEQRIHVLENMRNQMLTLLSCDEKGGNHDHH